VIFVKDSIKVACGLIEDGDLILVVKRGLQMRHSGMWEFPGGKVEVSETPEECLHREVDEELSIKIEITRRLAEFHHTDGSKMIHFFPFVAKVTAGEPKLFEHSELLWCEKEKLSKIGLLPADLAILEGYIGGL
jgi:mutator protein MutT